MHVWHHYVWTLWSEQIEFCLDLDFLIFYVRALFRHCTLNFNPRHNDPYVCRIIGMTLLRIPICSSGFIRDCLDH